MTEDPTERRKGHHELVELLYGTVAEPDSWGVFLDELARHLHGVMPGLGIGGAEPQAFSRECPTRSLKEWEEHYVGLLERVAREKSIRGAWRYGDADDPAITEFFDGFAWPLGVDHNIATNFVADGVMAGFGLYRELGAPRFSDGDLVFVDQLVPHARRAIELRGRISTMARERDFALGTIERLSVASLVVSMDGSISAANSAAELVLAAEDGLSRSGSVLRTAEPRAARRLRTLLRDVCELAGPGGTLAVPRTSGRRAWEISVSRLPTQRLGPIHAVIFIEDPSTAPPDLERRIRDLHGFTPAEARLAGRLVLGDSLAEIGEDLGVTQNTLRNQLKTLFSKTDTRRQAELVGLLLRGVAGTPIDDH